MADLFSDYERKLLQAIGRASRRIRAIYESSIETVAPVINTIKFEGKVLDLRKYPALKQKVEAVIRKMQPEVYSTIVNGINDSWNLSNEKNNIIVDRRLAGKEPSPKVKRIMYDANRDSLKAFITRKNKGMNLSQRVWNLLEPHKAMLEQSLGVMISEGKSAKSAATEMKQFLNQPDKLFRRVRDKEGNLVLSKAAQNYHPGQGVYRSSYKNALRLTRTEMNIANRTADTERWNNLPFVIGYQVKLSAAHPTYDICDPLAGKYPKDFKFVGWHPQCLCYMVPLFMSDEDYNAFEDEILGIANYKPKTPTDIVGVPAEFTAYLEANRDRING